MADTATHHQPESTNVKQSGAIPAFDRSAGSDNDTSTKSAGRKDLGSFDEDDIEDPAGQQEFANSQERIEENYPFFGTLLKRENGLYKRKEVISKDEPRTIEYVKERYQGGAYQLRQTVKGEGERKINFNVSGVEKPDNTQSGNSNSDNEKIDEKFITNLRKDLKKEIRSDYSDLIDRQKKRIGALNDELDELSRKNRQLSGEMAELERKSARNAREDQKEYERKIDKLKDEKRDLEFEVFELEQELRYSDAEQGFDLKTMLQDAANDPNIRAMLAPILAKLFGGGQMPQQPAALNGQRANPSAANSQPDTTQPTSSEASAQEGDNAQEDNSEPANSKNETQQTQMQQLVEQFQTGVIKTVASSMVNGQPEASELQELVVNGVQELENQGISPQPAMWVQIAKQLVEFALDNSVTAEKAANTIKPILQQLDGAANNLKYLPAKGAAHALINFYSIDVTDAQKQFLIDILDEFKQQLSQSE